MIYDDIRWIMSEYGLFLNGVVWALVVLWQVVRWLFTPPKPVVPKPAEGVELLVQSIRESPSAWKVVENGLRHKSSGVHISIVNDTAYVGKIKILHYDLAYDLRMALVDWLAQKTKPPSCPITIRY